MSKAVKETHLFQTDNTPEPEKENRTKSRHQFSDKDLALIEEVKYHMERTEDRIITAQKSCGDGCGIPADLKPHLPGIRDAMLDIGDSNIGRCIAIARDAIKKTIAGFKTADKDKDTFRTTAVRHLVTLFIVVLGYGIVRLIELQMKG